MESLSVEKDKFSCPYCGEKMYQLRETMDLTLVCPKCGSSIDSEKLKYKIIKPEDLNIYNDSKKNNDSIFLIFNNNFMKKYTKFDNLMDFIIAGRLIHKKVSCINYEIFKKIPKHKLDKYIRKNTIFDSWNEMFEKASSRYLKLL